MGDRTCKIDGCVRLADAARGWCNKHYLRWRQKGDPTAVQYIRGDDMARFRSKVDDSAGPDGCHLWKGPRSAQGYGLFSANGKMRRANRWLLGQLRGTPLRPDEHVLHRCDNPPCCNPAHLYVGDHERNMRDRAERRRHANTVKTHCKSGHPFGAGNIYFRANGARVCRECALARRRAYLARRNAA